MVSQKILYLASASPRRREILKKMRIPFRKVKSLYVEKTGRRISVRRFVLEHAAGKAMKAVVPDSARWVLGADTEVYHRGKILGKPRSEKEAFRMVSSLCGKTHAVYTGIAVLDRATGKMHKACDKTLVTMRRFSPEEVARYIKKAGSLDKAGGYAIQVSPKIVLRIRGSYSNVVGLPSELLLRLLRIAGFGSKS